ncbi:MAG: AMP-binding protein [Verrucomicrobia bacterium]|nr:AMP-binding protein [Verrucomicrobiota bacterium]
MRAVLHFCLRLLFGFRHENAEVLKTPGPVLLIPNHVCWIDWLFLYVLLELDWRYVVSRVAAQYSWVHRLLLLNRRTFPIDNVSPYAVKRMAEHLERGGRLVLYAEGQLTRTGSLMKIYEGTGFLLHRTQAKVITCYVRGAHRLRWSRQPGWRKWWPRITLHFSPVLTPRALTRVPTARARTQLSAWLRDRMVQQQFATEMERGPAHVLEAILDAARVQPNRIVLQDSTTQELSYRRLLVGADLLARRLDTVLRREPGRVGVLLPNVNAVPVVLLSLWARNKVPAILNFSTGIATLRACCELAGLKQVLTSRIFLARAKLNLAPLSEAGLEVLYLEDLRQQITGLNKLGAVLRQRMFPRALARQLAPAPPPPAQAHDAPAATAGDRSAVILFTSGSEGTPKGVELTHRNLLANIRQMLAVTDLTDHDRVFNALPTFHSFGLTVGLLLGLVRGLFVYLFPSPLQYRLIPTVLYDRFCTVFLSTNTFLNGYARRAHPYDFRALRYLFAAAEKVQQETFRTWSERFGVRILEGYGATECSPALSVNLPMAPRCGSAGRFLPGIEYRLEPVEGVSEGGRLFVRGPNVMRGYLNPEPNAAFQALGGWYDTGDIVRVDEDGFVFILGRLKRFAKVSGEMVSLTAVEDALAGAFPQYGLRCEVAVVARPDEDKGEALIAVTNEPRLRLGEIRAAIQAKGLTNLCAPREVKCVREIPKLGTGKVNHRELAKILVLAKGSAEEAMPT